MKTEFSEILTDIIVSHLPKSMTIGEQNVLIEDVLNYIGRVDYRAKHESLTWEHSKCLDRLTKHKT